MSGCRQQATLAGAAENERTEEKTREHKKCTSRKKKEQNKRKKYTAKANQTLPSLQLIDTVEYRNSALVGRENNCMMIRENRYDMLCYMAMYQ